MLDRCQNPGGCRHIAIKRVKAVDKQTGDVEDEVKLCAYCTEGLEPYEGYEIEVESLA